jgi:hypothetical protein
MRQRLTPIRKPHGRASRARSTAKGHTAEAHRAAASATRHEAAAHMKDVAKRPSWVVPVLIGVVALVLAIWGVRALSNAGEEDAISSAVARRASSRSLRAAGQISRPVKLGDGSQMQIGPDTKIYIPDQFPDEDARNPRGRDGVIRGRAGGTLPFHVVANHTHFIATGTKFAVSPIRRQQREGVRARGHGHREARQADRDRRGESAMVADAKGIRALPDDQKAEAFGWVNGQATAHGNCAMCRSADALVQLRRQGHRSAAVRSRGGLRRAARLEPPWRSARWRRART